MSEKESSAASFDENIDEQLALNDEVISADEIYAGLLKKYSDSKIPEEKTNELEAANRVIEYFKGIDQINNPSYIGTKAFLDALKKKVI